MSFITAGQEYHNSFCQIGILPPLSSLYPSVFLPEGEKTGMVKFHVQSNKKEEECCAKVEKTCGFCTKKFVYSGNNRCNKCLKFYCSTVHMACHQCIK